MEFDRETLEDAAIAVYLEQQVRPEWRAARIVPWERFIAEPRWKQAKALFARQPDQVRRVIERLAAECSIHRNDPEMWMCLGKVRQACGDHGSAIVAFEHSLELWSDNIRARYNIGLCLVRLGRVDEARAAFDHVLFLRPADERALSALAALSS